MRIAETKFGWCEWGNEFLISDSYVVKLVDAWDTAKGKNLPGLKNAMYPIGNDVPLKPTDECVVDVFATFTDEIIYIRKYVNKNCNLAIWVADDLRREFQKNANLYGYSPIGKVTVYDNVRAVGVIAPFDMKRYEMKMGKKEIERIKKTVANIGQTDK